MDPEAMAIRCDLEILTVEFTRAIGEGLGHRHLGHLLRLKRLLDLGDWLHQDHRLVIGKGNPLDLLEIAVLYFDHADMGALRRLIGVLTKTPEQAQASNPKVKEVVRGGIHYIPEKTPHYGDHDVGGLDKTTDYREKEEEKKGHHEDERCTLVIELGQEVALAEMARHDDGGSWNTKLGDGEKENGKKGKKCKDEDGIEARSQWRWRRATAGK